MRARGRRVPDGRLGPPSLRQLGLIEMKVLLVAAIATYLGVAGLVWVAQENLMFFPRPAAAHVRPPPGWQLEEVAIRATDGTALAGVLVLPPVERASLVIYFGGNAEEVTGSAAAAAEDYGQRAVLLVNYRGYGRSGGRPGQEAMLSDALEIHDWAARHSAIDPARIAVHGRSLGSAMAIAVAGSRPVRAAVLTSPFASALDVAREIYAWLPVSLLMRHPFDSAAAAAKARAPLLVLYGEEDTIIRPRHSERLASLWSGPVERASFKGFGHNDLQMSPAYGASIRAFLDKHL